MGTKYSGADVIKLKMKRIQELYDSLRLGPIATRNEIGQLVHEIGQLYGNETEKMTAMAYKKHMEAILRLWVRFNARTEDYITTSAKQPARQRLLAHSRKRLRTLFNVIMSRKFMDTDSPSSNY